MVPPRNPAKSAAKPKKSAKVSKIKQGEKPKIASSVKAPSKKSTSRKKAASRASIADEFKSGGSIEQTTSATVVFSSLKPGSSYEPGQPFKIERLISPKEVAAEYFARSKELDSDFAEARKVLAKWWPQLKKSRDFKKGHLTGASVRFRTKFGQVVSPLQVVIGINVVDKVQEKDFKQCGITTKLPAIKNGVPVKVVEGSFELMVPTPASVLRGSTFAPLNPLAFTDAIVGGAPIFPVGPVSDYGTLGVVVSTTDGFIGLTCEHVVGITSGQISQRGPNASGSPAVRPIGRVLKTFLDDHALNGRTETLDCAAVKLEQPLIGGPITFPPPPPVSWIRGVSQPDGTQPTATNVIPIYYSERIATPAMRGFTIWKFGSTSGVIEKGAFRDFDNLVFQVGSRVFTNNFTVTHEDGNQTFVLPGDSGSILALEAQVKNSSGVLEKAFVAIGILFASIKGSSSTGIACNMAHVLSALDSVLPTKSRIPKERRVSSWKLP